MQKTDRCGDSNTPLQAAVSQSSPATIL